MGRKRELRGAFRSQHEHCFGPDFDGYSDARTGVDVHILSDTDDSNSSDDDAGKNDLYQQLLTKQAAVERLKQKLKASIKHNAKRMKPGECSKDAFTRYSTTNLSNVISALGDHQKQVIRDHGFGSLLLFDKCFVPNKFAKWIARQVDWKSGDMVIKEKVISLTKKSVHLILGLPIGGVPFSSLPPPRKSVLMAEFNQNTMPQVSFFADKIIYGESLSDEELVICFLIVALNSFLCANSSLSPSTSYLSVLNDVSKAKEYDWCKFVLDWLLHSIKEFTKEKAKTGGHSKTLGGCLFYLAVLYLDCIDFGPRQVLGGIPRVGVWITNYSELDKICVGRYGYRPLLDVNKTCFAKHALNLQEQRSRLYSNADFLAKIDSSFGHKLPNSVKVDICNVIEHFCFQSSLSVEMDFSSVRLLPDELRTLFAKLIKHVCNIDSMAEYLVLSLLKILSDYCDQVRPFGHASETFVNTDETELSNATAKKDDCGNNSNPPKEAVECPSNPISDVPAKLVHLDVDSTGNNVSLPCAGKDTSRVESTPNATGFVLHSNLKQDGPDDYNYHTPGSSANPLSVGFDRCGGDALFKKTKSRANIAQSHQTITEIVSVRNPLCDLTNTDDNKAPSTQKQAQQSDVLYLDEDNDFVHDSASPTPKSSIPKFCSQKAQVLIDCFESTPGSSARLTPNLPSKQNTFSIARPTVMPQKSPPDVQFIGEETFADKLRSLTKRGDMLYNKNMGITSPGCSTPIESMQQLSKDGSGTTSNTYHLDDVSAFKFRQSSSGGVVPQYGPRRVVYPGPLLRGDYEVTKTKYQVTKFQLQNYEAICALATSEFSSETAVEIGRVRCTFGSFGDALKPNGFINNFLVSVYCRHLFLKPEGHPDVSKIHFFFPTISENLMNDPDDADYDLLHNSFKRASTARPLHRSNMLVFPSCFQNHWFVFVVDIKDRKFVFLDSVFKAGDEFQQYVKDRLIPSFQLVWDKCITVDMKFHEFDVIYPHVPEQGNENLADSGVYALMCLQHWRSPRTLLPSIFKRSDIKNIRILIANELMFNNRNSGRKDVVTSYRQKVTTAA